MRGEGFAPGGSVTLFQCAVDDLGDCVSDTAEVDGGGTFTRTVAVSARLCVPHPDDCLEVDPLDEETFESEDIGTVPLSFASDVALVVPSPTTASPTTGLTDGEAIVVRADGWRPGDGIQAATCPSPRPLAPACLAATTGVTDVVDDEGRLRAVVRAGAIVPAGDGSADCRRVPCFLHVGRYPDLTTFALGFAPSAPLAPPPTASARLVEGRTLAVRGEGFVPTEEVFATTCIRRDGPRRCLAPAPVHAAADEDGDVSITYEPGPFPGFAGVGDCRGADCFVLLSGSAAAGPAARDEARAPFAPDP